MKRLILIALLIIPIVASAAPDGGPVPFIKSNDEGTKVSLWIPGFLIKAASGIVKNDDAETAHLIRQFGTTSIKVIEGEFLNYDKYQRKMDRLDKRLDRRNYRDLIEVHTPNEMVRISYKKTWLGKQKLIITVLEEDTFVYLKTRCNLSFQELIKLASDM